MNNDRLSILGALSPVDLEKAPFGVVLIDRTGLILSYNAAEAALSHLTASRVIGKNFFHDIAPCTAGSGFEGRALAFIASDDAISERFNYFFPFAHGASDVNIAFVKQAGSDAILIVIERTKDAAIPAIIRFG